MKRQGAKRFPRYLAALETGNWGAEWTLDESTAGGWNATAIVDGYQNDVLDWTNNAGARVGLARFRHPYVAGRYSTDLVNEDSHTVHIRARLPNDSTWQGWALGPAVACSTGGNGYVCQSIYAAGRVIVVSRLVAWVATPILAFVAPVETNDVLSLGYTYDISGGEVVLVVLVNGVQVGTVTDNTAPIRMATVSGEPGIWGGSLPSLADTLDVGHWTPEWWVTDGQTFEEPPSKAQRLGNLRVAIMEPQQYTDSPDPKMRHLMSGAVLTAKWTHKRIGGPATMSCEIRFADIVSGLSMLENISAKDFDDPSVADWSGAKWLGGDMVLEYHSTESKLDENPALLIGQDIVWRGTVSGLSWNPDTRTISLSGEGLVNHLGKINVVGTYRNIRLKEIVRDLLTRYAKGTESSGQDTPVKYNPNKLVGDLGALDLKLTIDFQHESFTSALRKLFEYLPPGAVWGVDRFGDFYMDQQFPHYTEDLSSVVGIQHFAVDGDAVKFKKSLDFSRIRTAILVQGKEKDDPENWPVGETHVQAWAVNKRLRRMFGNRMTVQSDGSIRDAGLAQKVAAAQLKKLMLPAISADLSVARPLADNRELWESLVLGAPRVAVDDRMNNVQPILAGGAAAGIRTEYLLRLFGDEVAYRANDKGSAGASCTMASSSKEQNLNKQWALKVALKFDFAHPGTTGDSCFLFGRPDDTGAGNTGWGGLWWVFSTGMLEWRYRSSTGTVRNFVTNITVPVLGSGTEVHLFLYRDSNGYWHAYDGGVLKASQSLYAGDTLKVTTGDWLWWAHGRGDLAATQLDGDFSLDEFCLWDTVTVEGLNPVGASPIADLITNTHNQRLPRNRSHGLVLYLAFNFPSAGGSFVQNPAWRDPFTAEDPDVAIALWARSFATGTGDLAAISSGAVRGQTVGQEKKWGGPLVMDAEQVTYKVDSATGILQRDYKLGELPANVFTTLAAIQDELRRMNEDDRRSEEVAP